LEPRPRSQPRGPFTVAARKAVAAAAAAAASGPKLPSASASNDEAGGGDGEGDDGEASEAGKPWCAAKSDASW
jgi:hypothetical protein